MTDNDISVHPDGESIQTDSPNPVHRQNPRFCDPNHLPTALIPNTFIAQNWGIFATPDFQNSVIELSLLTLRYYTGDSWKNIFFDFLTEADAGSPEHYTESKYNPENDFTCWFASFHTEACPLVPSIVVRWHCCITLWNHLLFSHKICTLFSNLFVHPIRTQLPFEIYESLTKHFKFHQSNTILS